MHPHIVDFLLKNRLFTAVDVKEVRENVTNDLEDQQGSSRNSVPLVVSAKRPSDTCQTGAMVQQTGSFMM